MDFFQPYFIFIIPVLVFFATQLLKFVIHGIKHEWDIAYVFAYGHMPSSHTALVVSLMTAVGYYDGLATSVFAIAVCLATIVVSDAVRLRMYMGDQSRYLNMIVENLNLNKDKFPRLKERVGHRISEVAAGALFGFILTLLLI